MQARPLLHAFMAFAATSLIFACADDEKTDTGADEVGDGDGDGDGRGTEGDGDGEPTGDGDGEPSGDGDGDSRIDDCQTNADILAAELEQADGGCTILVSFGYDSLEPTGWASDCAAYPEETLDEAGARALSECCKEGTLLNPGDEHMFLLYETPEPDGGISVVSNHLGKLSFEATLRMMGAGDITLPDQWMAPDHLGRQCEGVAPEAKGYNLLLGGSELDAMELDAVLSAFADTALTEAIQKHGTVKQAVVFAFPRVLEPFDPTKAEYVMLIESGT